MLRRQQTTLDPVSSYLEKEERNVDKHNTTYTKTQKEREGTNIQHNIQASIRF